MDREHADRPYDLIVFGATGFTGGLTAEYLAANAPAELRWAIAGRSARKLAAVKRRLAGIHPACESLGLVQADVGDATSLRKLAESTRAVITTVGPYIHYGEPLVAACAAAGTHYLDLTGEPEFVELCLQRHDAAARASGACIINCCGFDSIPYDLGALFTVNQCPADTPITLRGFVRVHMTISGGTWQSAVHAFSRVRQYARLRAGRGRDPQPDNRRVGRVRQTPHYQGQLGTWVVPFPTIDPQVVRRSARALDVYGPDFRYGHYLQVRRLPVMLAGGLGAAGVMALSQFGPARQWLLSRKSAGQGPSAEERARNWFCVRFLADAGGTAIRTEVRGGDPGYTETAKMLSESALCLLGGEAPATPGVVTPAMALGMDLVRRLQAAGMVFDTQWSASRARPPSQPV